MDHLFSTGVFARMCNVTKQTLFHYDDIGLLKPHHKDNKGYRYYSYKQFDTMYVIESLKEIEMSLSEIKVFMENTTPELMVKMFSAKSVTLQKKIDNLIRIQKVIEQKISITESANETDFSSITLEEVNEEYLYLSEPILDSSSKHLAEIIADFYHVCSNKFNEGFSIGMMIGKEQLLQGDFDIYKYLYTKISSESIESKVYRKIENKQVIGYHVGSYESLGETYSNLLAYIDKNQYSISNYGYEEYILDAISVNDSNQYVTKIIIPVEI
ncbi:MerR family transcriptional regulator [Bacillus mesophilum]|uniref:MerR family transcriptional regulator n=1 Tax=Bacillus mesophilum TaxID=1071718 RepID=A0A7V7RHI5_9BACI|nr:MerR family transcriptional regulator [Bacillus mesophilum]KAB2328900.1 MerR family transcriptional regulator [Bacillus mesophilum]